jgi:hypothetical protein
VGIENGLHALRRVPERSRAAADVAGSERTLGIGLEGSGIDRQLGQQLLLGRVRQFGSLDQLAKLGDQPPNRSR